MEQDGGYHKVHTTEDTGTEEVKQDSGYYKERATQNATHVYHTNRSSGPDPIHHSLGW